VNLNNAVGGMERAHDELHRAGKDLLPFCESGDIPWHLHQRLIEIREAVRDVESQISEHVVATTETDHA